MGTGLPEEAKEEQELREGQGLIRGQNGDDRSQWKCRIGQELEVRGG